MILITQPILQTEGYIVMETKRFNPSSQLREKFSGMLATAADKRRVDVNANRAQWTSQVRAHVQRSSWYSTPVSTEVYLDLSEAALFTAAAQQTPAEKEGFCFRCRRSVIMLDPKTVSTHGKLTAMTAACPNCGSRVTRVVRNGGAA